MHRRFILIALPLILAAVSSWAAEQRMVPPSFPGQAIKMRMAALELFTMTRRIMGLEKDKKNAITAKQASEILKIVKPLRSKEKLPATEAQKALDGINKLFTKEQIKALEANVKRVTTTTTQNGPKPGGQFQSGPPPGFRPPDAKVTGSTRFTFSGSGLPEFNPFYSKPAKEGIPNQDMVKQVDEFMKFLEARVNGK